MTGLYLVPRHISDHQIQKVFKDSVFTIEDYNERDRIIILNMPATEQQDAIMQLIYNS